MSVAVVIPLFNGSRYIRQTLDSVFSQTQLPVEVVVVDDGSDDGSIKIVKQFTNLTLLRNPGKGANETRNFGFKHTSAPLVVFLDQDDIWAPSYLKTLSGILEQNPECMAALADCHVFKDSGDLHFDSEVENITSFDPWQNFPINRIGPPSSVMIRRKALQSIGGWPTKYDASADVYMWFRLSEKQPLLLNRHKAVGYRLHERSWSHTYRLQNVQKYFDELIDVSKDVLAYRVALYPQDTEALNIRLAALTSISGILNGLLDMDARLLSNSALDLESNLYHESIEYTNSMVGLIFYFLKPVLTQKVQLQKFKLLVFLTENWPVEARETRIIVLRRINPMLTKRAYVEYLIENPFKWNRWALLANIFYKKIIKRLK